eukprot:scaffold38315_cov29-Tisochrysis_lutea.AAC.4
MRNEGGSWKGCEIGARALAMGPGGSGLSVATRIAVAFKNFLTADSIFSDPMCYSCARCPCPMWLLSPRKRQPQVASSAPQQ